VRSTPHPTVRHNAAAGSPARLRADLNETLRRASEELSRTTECDEFKHHVIARDVAADRADEIRALYLPNWRSSHRVARRAGATFGFNEPSR
jgi:hypothetical protein